MQNALLERSPTVSFADVAHQTIIFNCDSAPEQLVLNLLDTRWMQRLRNISQTGNTRLVYMFAEHSRFGHSLGVAYLATLLMRNLRSKNPELIEPYQDAVSAAALLHDIGHVAPGSHLGERIWAEGTKGKHEKLSAKIIEEDPEIRGILDARRLDLAEQVTAILAESDSLPPWTTAIISGGGWNADRGNWAIVDSAMCSVSYGRYNVTALIDAFRLSDTGELVLQENRLDALTHFFVARDSMYRQVYQHRVLQAVDALAQKIVARVRTLKKQGQEVFADASMEAVLATRDYSSELPLSHIFHMTEHWWYYHIDRWASEKDPILSDLCQRLRDRRLLKTIRIENNPDGSLSAESIDLTEKAKDIARQLGFDPEYYVLTITENDKHREKFEEPPSVLLDSGEIVSVTSREPLIGQILRRPPASRTWLAVPKEVKAKLGRLR